MNMNPNDIFQHLAQGFGGAIQPPQRPASAYDTYLKAYSMAMLPGREREQVSYGGKIIMPPSALAHLTHLDIASPWMFKLRNPQNQAASTHAGVLEFIAQEGAVHLPQWMMKTLRLNEGDAIRISGADLQTGKFVKLQAQSVHFLEITDHKAVLEQTVRNYSCLTQGDVIEICYNSIVFGLLVMETKPGTEIAVLETDLEVDFAAPVGYVEPERPKPAPPSTMASKLKIDLDSASPGSSRPGSSLGGGFAGPTAPGVSKDGDDWESFKGKGETLAGRRTKGKGISHRKLETVAESSKIIRTDKTKVVTNDSLESDVKVPAALNLPFGKLFFGFKITPYSAPEAPAVPGSPGQPTPAPSFGGSGNTLNGRSQGASSSSSKAKGKAKALDTPAAAATPAPSTSSPAWGVSGNTLGARNTPSSFRSGTTGAGGAPVPMIPKRKTAAQKQKERSPTPDFGVDDDDIMYVDSD